MQPFRMFICFTFANEENFQRLCSHSQSQFHHLAWNTESTEKQKKKNSSQNVMLEPESTKQKELPHFQNTEVICWAHAVCV